MFPQLLTFLLAVLPAANGPCTGDWRGVPLKKALGDVTRRCGVQYLADASLSADALDREVRLSVKHLTGQQTARWLARIAGLESVEVEGSLVLADPKRAKLITKELNPQDATRRSRADASAWRDLKNRRAPVSWDQTPLSRVASDVSTSFGVDVIYHPDLLSEPSLITMSREDADIAQVAATLADQLHATVEFLDGALWVHPSAASREPAAPKPSPEVAKKPPADLSTRPEASAEPASAVAQPSAPERQPSAEPLKPQPQGQPSAQPEVAKKAQPEPQPAPKSSETRPAAEPPVDGKTSVSPVAPEQPADQQPAPRPETPAPADLEKALNKPMVLDRSVGNWQELAARVREAAGVRCTIQVPTGATYPGLAAEGTIREILEAGRLLGYLTWSVDPPSVKGPGGIRISVLTKG